MVPPQGEPSLSAVSLSTVSMDGAPGVYVLVAEAVERGSAESWTRSTLGALTAVREQVSEPPEGVTYRVEEGALDMVQQVEASALGLSLLQIALNRAGSGLGIEVRS
jgi:hypothetical protein